MIYEMTEQAQDTWYTLDALLSGNEILESELIHLVGITDCTLAINNLKEKYQVSIDTEMSLLLKSNGEQYHETSFQIPLEELETLRERFGYKE